MTQILGHKILKYDSMTYESYLKILKPNISRIFPGVIFQEKKAYFKSYDMTPGNMTPGNILEILGFRIFKYDSLKYDCQIYPCNKTPKFALGN